MDNEKKSGAVVEIDDNTGYVKEPDEDQSLFGYLEAAYGVERAESLTIGLYEMVGKFKVELFGEDEVDG